MYIVTLLIRIAMVIFAITIHEFSHALAAYSLGDDTAKRMGRLSLNPIKHLDILGAIMLLIARVGWAKPVPINPYNFRNMKIDTALTAAAGPASNFVMAIFAAMLYRMNISLFSNLTTTSFFVAISMFALKFAVIINIALGLFNLIPIPPLDGSKIIGGFMPDDMYFRWATFERTGAYLLMLIFAISFIFKIPLIHTIIYPPLNFFTELLIGK